MYPFGSIFYSPCLSEFYEAMHLQESAANCLHDDCKLVVLSTNIKLVFLLFNASHEELQAVDAANTKM